MERVLGKEWASFRFVAEQQDGRLELEDAVYGEFLRVPASRYVFGGHHVESRILDVANTLEQFDLFGLAVHIEAKLVHKF